MSRTKHHNPDYNNQEKGNFDLAYHLEMVSDYERVGQFKKGIDKVINQDSIFCELGCGTGIFSIYAAQKAKKVYAVELDENIYQIAKKNINNSGLSDKITLIHGDASEVILPEKADIIFCEMLSIWMIEEPQVLIMNHAIKNLLKPNGITIPEKIINIAELCNTNYDFSDVQIKAPIAQFTGIKHPRIMTESKVVNTVGFNKENNREVNITTQFTALTSGIINSVRLSSIVKIADGINFYSTDTLMPLTIVPLENEVYVNEGEKVKLIVRYAYRNSLDSMDITALTLLGSYRS
jgi:type I protein arginine methyltransferase